MKDPYFKPEREDPFQSSRSLQAAAEIEVERIGKFHLGRVSTIGRAQESDVVLNINSVSRNHARIFFEGGHYWVKDLESANGTRVNGKSVTLQMLTHNDKIRFGEVQGVFLAVTKSSGPALIAQDPLAGSDRPIEDGTPTGGISGATQDVNPEGARFEELEATVKRLQGESVAKEREIARLSEKNKQLRRQNERLAEELESSRATSD